MKFPILLPNIFNYPFTYESDLKLKIGDFVEVPFGKSKINDDIQKKFVENIKKITSFDERQLFKMGLNGKKYAEQEFSKSKLIEKLNNFLTAYRYLPTTYRYLANAFTAFAFF